MLSQKTVTPQQVSWEALKQSSSNFKMAKISQPNSHKILIERGNTMMLFMLAMIALMTVTIISRLGSLESLVENMHFNSIHMVSFVMPIIASVVPFFFLMRRAFGKTILDKSTNSVSKSGLFSGASVNRRLDDIVALQLLKKYTPRRTGGAPGRIGSGGGFDSAELNLVFSDGSRVNINNGGSVLDMKNDSVVLAQFLNIPVWEAS